MTGKKQIAVDAALNVVATAIPLCLLQLVILPMMASDMSAHDYGLVVTTLSIFNILPGVFGNVLNNVRLVFQNRYDEEGVSGDFNAILICSSFICSTACMILLVIFGTSDLVSLFLMFIASFCWISREYFLVAFRIKINYLKILVCNIVQTVGYLLGYGLFLVTHQWVFVYLLGQGLSLVYILCESDLHREPCKTTFLFKDVLSSAGALSLSQFLSKFMAYSDRILLFPLLGGGAVGIYYISSLMGKIVSMAVTPINGVMLTYLSKRNTANRPQRAFWTAMLSALTVCIFSYLAVIVFGRSVLAFLYPSYVDKAMVFLPITSITAFLYILISVAQPFTLKYYSMKWQVVINGATCAAYVLLGLLLLSKLGLMGFCVGALTSNFLKLLIMLGVYVFLKPDSKSLTYKHE